MQRLDPLKRELRQGCHLPPAPIASSSGTGHPMLAWVMSVRGHNLPPAVAAFVVVQVGNFAYGLITDTKITPHVVFYVAVVTVSALWVAAVAVWRQRWAWWLYVIASCLFLLSPVWGQWYGILRYTLEVVVLALLISPQMRRYVNEGRTAADPRGTNTA